MPIATRLAEYWTCDEFSGNRVGSKHGIVLRQSNYTGFGGVGFSTGGKLGRALAVPGQLGSTNLFSTLGTDWDTRLAYAGNGFTMAFWLKVDALGTPIEGAVPALLWEVNLGNDFPEVVPAAAGVVSQASDAVLAMADVASFGFSFYPQFGVGNPPATYLFGAGFGGFLFLILPGGGFLVAHLP